MVVKLVRPAEGAVGLEVRYPFRELFDQSFGRACVLHVGHTSIRELINMPSLSVSEHLFEGASDLLDSSLFAKGASVLPDHTYFLAS